MLPLFLFCKCCCASSLLTCGFWRLWLDGLHICGMCVYRGTSPLMKHNSTISIFCHNPSLGLATKARVCKGASQEGARESHFMLLGVQESVREWTLTLPNELPFWELESQWTSESLEGDYRGQNSLDWKVPYIIARSWNLDV